MRHKVSGMAYLDNHIQRIIEKLLEIGQFENTIILFMADHNIEPGKATCYEYGIQIPMILMGPGIEPGISSSLAQTVDIYPTILQLAGVPMPDKHPVDGISMSGLLKNPKHSHRKYVYTEAGYARSVLDDQDNKYIQFFYPDHMLKSMQNNEIDYAPNMLGQRKQAHSDIAIASYPHYFDAEQLYDLNTDPYETKNLANDSTYANIKTELENVYNNNFLVLLITNTQRARHYSDKLQNIIKW